MLPFHLTTPEHMPLSVLAIGAHPDDIEIGAGGTLLSLAESRAGIAGPLRGPDGDSGAPAGGPRTRPAPSCRPPTSPSNCSICQKAGCLRSGAR